MNYRMISRQMTALALAVFLAAPGQVRAEENVAEMLVETQAETPAETTPPETVPPETAPPATEAPVTEAPVTEAAVTEAPVTEAPAAEAPAETLPGGESETQTPAETVPDEAESVTEGATEAVTGQESEKEKETEKKETEKKETETELDREAILKDYVKSKPFSDPKERTLYDASLTIEGIPSFITQEMIEGAIHCQDEYGFPASVTIAQIIAESGYGAYGPGGEMGQGLSSLAYYHCNLFGIKGSGTAGSVSMKTWEMRANGTSYTTSAGFRAYYTYTECIEDRAELLKEYYRDLTNGVTDANTFAVQVGSRWATNVYYGKTLISIMKQYDLYRLDELTLIDWKAQEQSGTTPESTKAENKKTENAKKNPVKKQETKAGAAKKKNMAALPVSDGLGVFGSAGRLSGGVSLSAGKQLSGGIRLNAGGSPVLSAGGTLTAGMGTSVGDPEMLAEVNDWLKEMRMPFVQMLAVSAGAMSWLL